MQGRRYPWQLRRCGEPSAPRSEVTIEPPPADEKVPFRVKTNPADARVCILNICPRYQDGIRLKPGDYRIKVTNLAFGCVLLARLALWLRPGHVPVVIEAEMDDLTLRLDEDWPWRGEDLKIGARRLRLTNLQALEALGLGVAGAASQLEIQASEQGAELRLWELHATAGAELSLQVSDYPSGGYVSA